MHCNLFCIRNNNFDHQFPWKKSRKKGGEGRGVVAFVFFLKSSSILPNTGFPIAWPVKCTSNGEKSVSALVPVYQCNLHGRCRQCSDPGPDSCIRSGNSCRRFLVFGIQLFSSTFLYVKLEIHRSVLWSKYCCSSAINKFAKSITPM